MKLLADMGVSQRVTRALRDDGHDVVHLLDRRLERLPDAAIVDLAKSEGRVVLTFDLDFADLLASSRASQPSAIIFRLSSATPNSVLTRLLPVLQATERSLKDGAIVVVEDHRYRARKLPIC